MKQKRLNNPSGFTLIEMMIYIGLLVAFQLVFTKIFIATLSYTGRNITNASLSTDNKYILSRLSYDIRRATSTTLPNNSTLTLLIPPDTYTYSLQNNNLELTMNANTPLALNDSTIKISNLSFQKVGNSSPGSKETVIIQFTESLLNGTQQQTVQETVGRR